MEDKSIDKSTDKSTDKSIDLHADVKVEKPANVSPRKQGNPKLTKGTVLNPNGRPKGSKNKNKTIRDVIHNLDAKMAQVVDEVMASNNLKLKADIFKTLVQYAVVKPASEIDINKNEQKLVVYVNEFEQQQQTSASDEVDALFEEIKKPEQDQ